MQGVTARYEFDFVAPVPHGHGVLIAKMDRARSSLNFVLDRTASTLYGDEELWHHVSKDDVMLTVRDPVTVLTRQNWVPRYVIVGASICALVSTSSSGDPNHAKTYLIVESERAPYR
jgi:hypothetical protein